MAVSKEALAFQKDLRTWEKLNIQMIPIFSNAFEWGITTWLSWCTVRIYASGSTASQELDVKRT